MERKSVGLEEVGQIALTVSDLEQAKSFYRDVLGLRFLFDAGTMAFFQCGTVRLLLGTPQAGDAGRHPFGTIVYFRVSDLPATCARLKDMGIVLSQEPHLVARMKTHELWLAFLNDPSGNTLGLMSEVPRAE